MNFAIREVLCLWGQQVRHPRIQAPPKLGLPSAIVAMTNCAVGHEMFARLVQGSRRGAPRIFLVTGATGDRQIPQWSGQYLFDGGRFGSGAKASPDQYARAASHKYRDRDN